METQTWYLAIRGDRARVLSFRGVHSSRLMLIQELRAEALERLVERLAQFLESEYHQGLFQTLIVVAPQDSIRALEDALPACVARTLVSAVCANLVGCPDQELDQHVQHLLFY